MSRIPFNLYNLYAGCEQIPRGTAEHLANLWESTRSAGQSFTEFLLANSLTQCDAVDMEFLSDERFCQPAEFELRVDGYGLIDSRFRNEWFEGGNGSGALHLWEAPLPVFAFANSLLRYSEIAATRHSRNPAILSPETPTPKSSTPLVAAPAGVAAPPPVAPPAVGSTLGRCILERELGRGASSIVFLATHTKLGIKVAVKVLQAIESTEDENPLEVVRREARLLAQITHPNVVRIFDVEDEGPWPYMVMEHVEGKSLSEVLENGPLSIVDAVQITMQAAEGLAAANKLGVIHRDVKPENLSITNIGQVKVIDFGVGVHAKAAGSGSGVRLVGTAQYLSPEQAESAPHLDHRSDMYSLGATLYHALTGKPPFDGPTLPALLLQHAMKQPVPPRDLRAEIPDALNGIVLRLLNKSPDQRYSTYEALLSDLGTSLLTGKTQKPSKKGLLPSWLRRDQNPPRV